MNNTNPQQIVTIALVSALASNALSFIVRRILDARLQREAERKISYVLLVRVSGLLATETVLRAFIQESLSSSKLGETLNKAGAKYGVSHIVSVILSLLLNSPASETIARSKQFQAIPRHLNRVLEDSKQSRLTPEQLAKLPREAVAAFDQFQAEGAYMCDVASLWSKYIEHRDVSWVTSEVLHSQWRTLTRLLDGARSVRDILIKHGAASRIDADKLLGSQVATLKLGVMSGLSDQQSLALAASILSTPPSSSGPTIAPNTGSEGQFNGDQVGLLKT